MREGFGKAPAMGRKQKCTVFNSTGKDFNGFMFLAAFIIAGKFSPSKITISGVY
jgi:hypothetical protein